MATAKEMSVRAIAISVGVIVVVAVVLVVVLYATGVISINVSSGNNNSSSGSDMSGGSDTSVGKNSALSDLPVDDTSEVVQFSTATVPSTDSLWTITHSSGQSLQYDAATQSVVLVDTPAVPTSAQTFRFLATAGGDNSYQIAPSSSSTVVLVLNDDYAVGLYPNTARNWTLTNVQGSDGKTYTTLLSSFGTGRYLAVISSTLGSSLVSLDSNGFAAAASGPASIQWTITRAS